MNKFEIIKLSTQEVYVIILGTGNFGDFISELENRLSQLKYEVANVYLDMFLRHGIDNRFLYIQFCNRKLNLGSVDEIEVNMDIQRMYNRYIMKHQDILSRGLLSTNQQIRFLDYIKEYM